ncbi:MAG TPA: hypothetical protein VNW89_00280, partial [Stellaceae bacterium]|nr:hypothetical protein [Stellaceae bacterium]
YRGVTGDSRETHRQAASCGKLFDWLIIGQVLAVNPAHAVRGPKHVVRRGKTPVLTEEEARRLLESIDTSTLVGLRDRALIGVMTYAFARIGAVVAMKVEDYYPEGKRWWMRPPTGLPLRSTCRGAGPLQVLKTRGSRATPGRPARSGQSTMPTSR